MSITEGPSDLQRSVGVKHLVLELANKKRLEARKKARKASQSKRSIKLKTTNGDVFARENVAKQPNICPHCKAWIKAKKLVSHEKQCRLHKEETFLARLAKCPHCSYFFLRQKLVAHIAKSHNKPLGTLGSVPIKFVLPELSTTQSIEEEEATIRCKECFKPVYPSSMGKHIQNFHSEEALLRERLQEAKKFPFVLLPAGSLFDAIDFYRKLPRRHSHSLVDAKFDWSRLEQIESFNPIARYVGLKSWKGYVVFEFQHSDRVILECPKAGNATYILSGEWRGLISATKAELRSEYRHLVTRIIHTSDWQRHVKQTVFGSLLPKTKSILATRN